TAFKKTANFQYDVVNLALKWAVLDQTQDDPCSLAVGAAWGRTDTKAEFLDPGAGVHNLKRDHQLARGAYAVVHYDTPWFTQQASVRYAGFSYESLTGATPPPPLFSAVSPG